MRFALALGALLLSGCLAYVHSPPGRSFPLESSKALYKRETGVQLEVGGGVGAEVGLPGFNLRVRHGIVDKLDGSSGNIPGDVFNGARVFTYGWTAGFGLRIPLVHDKARATAPAMLLGTRFRGAYYENQEEFDRSTRLGRELYWYGSFGFEYVFAPRRAQLN